MTDTTSAPARTPRSRPLRRLRGAGRAALVVAALVAPMLAVPAHATPTPTPSGPELSGETELTLSPVGNGIVRPGEQLAVSATIANGTEATVPATTVTLELGTEPIPDRSGLASWLADTEPAALPPVAEAPLAAVVSGTDATSAIVVPPDVPALAERGAGVYPLRATVVVDGQTHAATSVFIVPDDAVTASVGVVVPITAPPGSAGLLGVDKLAELTAPDGELTAQLDAVEGTSAILAVDPALPAAIRARGTAAPPSAIEWLARLEALPLTRFALQFGDADLATQVHASLPTPLQPTSLLSYLSPEVLADPPTQTPTATPDPTASPAPTEPADDPEATDPLPDLAQLTAIGNPTQAGVFWPATGSAGSDVIAALGATTVEGAPPLTLVPSDTTTAGSGNRTVRARATAAGAQLLVYDSEISAALHRAAGETDTPRRAASLTEATAYLAFAARESGGQPILVTVDRGTDRERVGLRTALNAAALAPGVTPAEMPVLTAAEPLDVGVGDIPADAPRVAELTQLLGDEAQIASFATILADPALLTGRQRAEILQLLAVAWRAEPEAATTALAAHREQTQETLDAVGILPSSTLNLISYDASFGPWVRNDLPYEANLVLMAQPNDPRLVVTDRTEVVAAAAQNTRVTIPVQARIGNGRVTLTMQLYSPTGVPIGTVQSAEVEVRAEWETIGLVILVSLMVLFVGLGIFRTVRRRRARAREQAEASLEPEVRTDDPGPEVIP